MKKNAKAVLGAGGFGEPITIDVAKLIESRMLVQANSGGGKSYAVRRLLEQTRPHVQQIIIDPEDEFHTLRERFDYVIARPSGGDCVADPISAAKLCERLLDTRASAIIQIYELKGAKRTAFVKNFLEALMNAPHKHWRPLMLVLDEAQSFCPEKGAGESEAAQAVIDLMKRGRKRGFGAVLATQRISDLLKSVAAEANNKLVGRCTLDTDMARGAKELGFHGNEEPKRLRKLKPGNFFVYGPAICDEVTSVAVGQVETKHPRAGTAKLKIPPPRKQFQKTIAKFDGLAREVTAEQQTLATMRAEIAALKAQLKAVPAPREVKPVMAKPLAPLISDRKVEKLAGDMQKLHSAMITIGKRVASQLEGLRTDAANHAITRLTKHALPQLAKPPAADIDRLRRKVTLQTQVNEAVRPKAADAIADGKITPAQQRILNAIAWWGQLGIEHPSKAQVAFVAEVRPSSGAYANNLGSLRTTGLITYPKGAHLALTATGQDAAVHVDVPTVDELRKKIRDAVTPAQWRILEALIAADFHPRSKEVLANGLGVSPTSGAFANNLGALRTLQLIAYPSGGMVVALPILKGE